MEAETVQARSAIREKVVEFIISNFLFGDRQRLPPDDASFLETGVIDSTGILELIEFLEEEFGISVEDDETVPENLDGIANVTAFVSRKQSGDSDTEVKE